MSNKVKYALGGAVVLLLIFLGYKWYKSSTMPAATDSQASAGTLEDKVKSLFDEYVTEFGKTTGNLTSEAKDAVNTKLNAVKAALKAVGYGVYQRVGSTAPYGLTLQKAA